MSKTQIVRVTKQIAKRVMSLSLFRLILLVTLETATAVALSLVFSALGERIAPTAMLTLGPVAIHVPSLLLSLVANLFLLPFNLGLTEYLLCLVRRQETQLSNLFLWYSDGEKLKKMLRYFLYTATLALLTVPFYTLPSQYLLDSANQLLEDLQNRLQQGETLIAIRWELLNVRAVVICVISMVVCSLLQLRLFLTDYIFLDAQEGSAFAAAKASWQQMKGHWLTYLWFGLSFLGWYAFSALTGFLILLYVLPYVRVSAVILSEYIRAEHQMKTDGIPTQPTGEASKPAAEE